MKATAILALLGTTIFTILDVNAHAVPEAVVEVSNGQLGFPEAKRDNEVLHPCWRAPDDSIQCPVVKRDAEAQPCFDGPGGIVACPVKKREFCWEANDGQIHCSNPPEKKREFCWEAEDGQIHCSNPPEQKREFCWEAQDGQIHCSNPPKAKRDDPCYEAPDGQSVHCPVVKRVDGTASLPVIPGTSIYCSKWYNVTTPDPLACSKALAAGNIGIDQFRALNPSVNNECTNVMVGYAYCVGCKSLHLKAWPWLTSTVAKTHGSSKNGTKSYTNASPTSTTAAWYNPIAKSAASEITTAPGDPRFCLHGKRCVTPPKRTRHPAFVEPFRKTDFAGWFAATALLTAEPASTPTERTEIT
ncbi:MAG: hypothetical protein Q9191_002283 [Dirinaria sp. TL-2023a]